MSGGKIVAAAALGAGAYYLLGPNSKEHRKKAKALFIKMKSEVTKRIRKVKQITPPLYHKAVDAVSKTYAKQYKLHEKDINSFAKKLKTEWQARNKTVKKTARKSKTR